MIFSYKIPVLIGATGTGKSALAYELSQRLNTHIVSVDAFQIYKGVEIGTGQPPLLWKEKVSHHFIASVSLPENWSAGLFVSQALHRIRQLQQQNQKVILVGGAGFYLKSLIEGVDPTSLSNSNIRYWIHQEVLRLGSSRAHDWLRALNQTTALKIHPNDAYRISRALEKYFGSTSIQEPVEKLGSENVIFIGLKKKQKQLDLDIKDRILWMWKNGLILETQNLINSNIPRDHMIWKAIGYRETEMYLKREINEAEALNLIYTRTHQYSKRQQTWFRHQHSAINWLDVPSQENVKDLIPFVLKILGVKT